MDNNEVWPPPIDKETTGQSAAPPKCSRAATILGVMSLVVTLPGFLLVAMNDVNLHFLHSKAWIGNMVQLGNGVIVLTLLPLLSLVLGICSWRSQWGKVGVGCFAIYAAFTCYSIFFSGW